MATFLFVYGTLKSTFPYHDAQSYLVGYGQFHSTGTVQGTLYDLGEYPGLLLEGETTIHGEVYKVLEPATLLEALDEFEDYRPQSPGESLYIRKKIPVKTPNGLIEAWVYEYNQSTEDKPTVADGNYQYSGEL